MVSLGIGTPPMASPKAGGYLLLYSVGKHVRGRGLRALPVPLLQDRWHRATPAGGALVRREASTWCRKRTLRPVSA